jgi:D-amino-acid dehydrogenase
MKGGAVRVIIIGAGILGASTAFHLALAGAEVTIAEAELEGRATAAGAGIVCPWVSGANDPAFYRLYVAGARYYAELVPLLAEHGEADLGYRRVGALVVSEDASELAASERELRRRRGATPEMGEITLLASRETRALFPPLCADLSGLHVANGARVDGRRLTAALLRVAQRLGTRMVMARAEPLVRCSRVTAVRLGADVVEADCVIVTAGAWAASLLRPLGLALPIEPQRGQIVHLLLPGHETDHWPVILPPGGHYLLAFEAGRIVVGATRESGAGFDFRVTAAGQAEVLHQALRVAPGLGAATVVETRVGFRPVGPDIRPMLGAAPNLPGLTIGNGLGAAGLTIGPFAGRLLADAVLGHPALLDLSPFDPSRPSASNAGAPPLR